jgi:hypothetical protein
MTADDLTAALSLAAYAISWILAPMPLLNGGCRIQSRAATLTLVTLK